MNLQTLLKKLKVKALQGNSKQKLYNCPFCKEDKLTADKATYECMGCKAGGGAISLLMAICNLSYSEAMNKYAFMIEEANPIKPTTTIDLSLTLLLQKLKVKYIDNRGKNELYSCPLCKEYAFYADSTFYSCNNCNKVGNYINLIEELYGLSEEEAYKKYAKLMHLEVKVKRGKYEFKPSFKLKTKWLAVREG